MNLKVLNKLYVNGHDLVLRVTNNAQFIVVEITDNISTYGYVAEDFLSKNICWRDVVHPDDHEILANCVRDCSVEYRLLKKSGEHVKIVCTCATDGDDSEYIWLHIREQKRETERFKILGNNIPDGCLYLIEHDLNTNIEKMSYVSENWESVTGISEQKMKDDLMSIIENMHPDDINRFMAANEKGMADMSKFFCEVRKFVDNRWRWLQISSIPHKYENLLVWEGIIQDITERKEAEMQLIAEKERLEAIGNNIPDGTLYRCVYEKNTEKMYMEYVSSTWRKVTGLPINSVLGDMTAFNNAVHPDDYKYFDDLITISMLNLTNFNAEVRIVEKEGTIRWLHFVSTPYENGDKIVWDGIVQNISRRKESEQNLAIERDRIDIIGEHIPDGSLYRLMFDGKTKQTKMVYASISFELVTGIPYDKVLDDPMSILNAMHPDDQQHFIESNDYSIENCTHFFCEARVFAENQWRWLQFSSIPRHEGDDIYWEGIILNITDRKETENQLIAEKERLRAIGDNLPDCALYRLVRIIDTGKMYMEYVSASMERVTGVSTETVVKDMSAFFNLVHPDDINYLMYETDKSQENLSYFDVEIRIGDVENPRWLRIVSQPHISGNKAMWDGIFRDITNRKKSEIELDEYRKNLEKLVKIRTEEFEANNEELTSSNEELTVVNEELNAVNEELNAANEELNMYRTELEKMVDVQTHEVVAHKQRLEKLSKRQAMFIDVLQIVQNAENLSQALNESLAEMGKFINVSRVYIFEKNKDGTLYSNTYEWCNEGIVAVKDTLQNIPIEMSHSWFDIFDAGGFICTSDIYSLTENLAESLEEQGIKSIVVLPLTAYNIHFGFVGFDDCVDNRVWVPEDVELLHSLSQMVSSTIQRMRAEIAIVKSEAINRQLIAASPDPIVVCEPNGRLVYMSEMALSLFGLTDPNVKKFRVLKFIHPHERRETIKLLDRIASEEIVLLPQLMLLRDDGSGFFGEVSAAYIKDEYGTAHSIIMVIRDITQRRIDEMELIRAKEKAEESDKLKSAFLANLSHEIRTPLNAILGLINILELGGMSQEALKECATLINTNSQHLLKMIDNIIDVSKIEVEQMELNPVPLHLNNMMGELKLLFESYIQSTNKEVSLIFDDTNVIEPSVITVDAKRLRQVLDVLLDNAIKFTDQGYIRFGYREIPDGMLEFFVEDSGIGINQNLLDVIFESFRQVELSNSRRFGGVGLGLTISRGLVKLMGGSMWVKSTEGEGATFYFTIPYE